jgi:hypothetical protein
VPNSHRICFTGPRWDPPSAGLPGLSYDSKLVQWKIVSDGRAGYRSLSTQTSYVEGAEDEGSYTNVAPAGRVA